MESQPHKRNGVSVSKCMGDCLSKSRYYLYVTSHNCILSVCNSVMSNNNQGQHLQFQSGCPPVTSINSFSVVLDSAWPCMSSCLMFISNLLIIPGLYHLVLSRQAGSDRGIPVPHIWSYELSTRVLFPVFTRTLLRFSF